MKKFVVMSGGFHPFHAGHASLYQQAKEKFPDATVLVCATNVQEERPFPFSLKKKLAQLSGVPPKDFIEVSRQFSVEDPALAQRIGDPNKVAVIFVRSDKDKNEPPIPWRLGPDGKPPVGKKGKPLSNRLLDYPGEGQPLYPASKHVYMDYLKTVEFGPGITSASKIREMWPKLNDKRKLAMVMSLYPATQQNLKLAQNVVGMFDQVMGGQVNEGEVVPFKKPQPLSWEQLPKYVLRLANDWYWAEQDNSGVDALMDPKGFGSGTNNDLKYITAKLQQLGWGIDYNDEYDGPGEFNLRLTNKRGQTVLLSIEDAQDFKGWAKGTNSLNEDAGTEFILYINGKPAAKYNELHQAERDVGLIQNKNPNAKFEIKKEVCNLVSVPIGLKEALLKEFAPSDDGDDQEEFFFKMAKQWWLGTEQQMIQVVKTLDKMGYEIGEDTGYDDGGVFIVKSGDQNGGSYMSWSHEDLSGLNEAANAARPAAIAINMKKQGKKPKTNESVDYLEEK